MAIHQITIGATDLLNRLFHPKDLGAAFTPATRGQEGSAGHHLVSTRHLPGYRAEVPIDFLYERDPFRLRIRGRIDGLLESTERLLVEEVKTTYLPLDALEPAEFPQHLAQIKLYLHFVMAKSGKPVAGQLTYLNLEDLSERSFPVELSREAAAEFFTGLAESFLGEVETAINWQAARDQSLRRLRFPYEALRSGQSELMSAVEQAIQSERDLLAEAATGIGKTVAVLYPALQSLAAGKVNRLFFLTAKTVGKDIVRKTIASLREQGLRLRTLFIEAKERVCFEPGAPCHPEVCPYTTDYYARIEPLLPELLAAELILPEQVLEAARRARVCPFELSLDLALHADLIVGDYNYIFDPGVFLRRFFNGPKKRDAVFLIDEAHNLVARGREMYSATLRQAELSSLEWSARQSAPRLAAPLQEVLEFFDQWEREIWREGRPGLRLSELPELMETKLERLAAVIELFLRRQADHPLWERVRLCYFELTAAVRVIAKLGPEYAIYLKQETDGVMLRLFCINPGPVLQEKLDYCRSAVFFSATLTPPDYFRELLGARDPIQLRLASPFPRENRLYLHVPGIDTRFHARQETAAQVAQCAAALVQAHPGNYLMFFPSYAYLQMLWPLLLRGLGRNAAIHVQSPGMSGKARTAFLQKVSGKGPGSNLGLAVLGGVFGEAVDLPGEDLVGVIIVGPGLPLLDDEQELIRMHFDEWDGKGTFYAAVIPGMIRVIQSAGRVFRSPEDRGVVLLLDDRFCREPFYDLLPPDWFLPGRPFSSADYREILADFWSGSVTL
ncbi:DNA excision repair protein ERCC-2 [Hydrogenispora ethanolica]|uniref:DNA excision repair protein ERCC-2 n=1 Tax=Hydrogenispora ethanolica TaxID=1082276 RepID=A0A4R1S7C9_HYDET|nr:ATP-dependent DNA helicase [Hydrogenispora ethanolica]TCL75231.1 DNA excision repair protein ERCC-2 [Hydrogenispora ethanolica]